jgi:hypothetical protein
VMLPKTALSVILSALSILMPTPIMILLMFHKMPTLQ